MADAIVGLDEPTTIDKMVDVESLTVGTNTVLRQRVQVTGTAAAAIATVGNANPASNAYGLTVRTLPGATQTVDATALDIRALVNTTDSVDAVQSGTWSLRAQDGSGNALVSSATTVVGDERGLVVRTIPSGTQTITGTVSVTGEVDITPASPAAATYLPVRISDGSAFVSPGTEYTEGDTDTTITGTAILWEASSDTLSTVNATARLPVALPALSLFRSIDLDESEEEVKATAAVLYGWYLYNNAAAARFVKFYNATAANVTVGSTTPVLTMPLPATGGANVSFPNGITFSTALTVAATTALADADTGAPDAGDVVVNLFYL